MDERNHRTRASGMNTWRAGCDGSRTSGSEGGPEKPTDRKTTGRSGPTPTPSTAPAKADLAVVIDAWSRRVVGWSIADHMRSDLVVDALEMARWRRRPQPGTIVHSDRGSQYTSWVFGHRLRAAGLLGSMGRVASSVDNGMIESFWSTMQRDLLDRRTWTTRDDLATAIFEWVEAFYNPVRRHSALDYLSPAEYETRYWTTLAQTTDQPAA